MSKTVALYWLAVVAMVVGSMLLDDHLRRECVLKLSAVGTPAGAAVEACK